MGEEESCWGAPETTEAVVTADSVLAAAHTKQILRRLLKPMLIVGEFEAVLGGVMIKSAWKREQLLEWIGLTEMFVFQTLVLLVERPGIR